ncbi:CocE/NonD family hydrolase [Luteibacter sahnii]|uniref:CocE/NonD family hydrolase n=1 Tax=Luteibacter sahnii TaxID=3021977 RepID=UPI002A6B2DA8|nr:CocE/NonD family hydrolase [Luteibacter sp. PPL193]MDY1549427.1 CocE/NonD family hydrolase [Luteibacter sp. PPL193]
MKRWIRIAAMAAVLLVPMGVPAPATTLATSDATVAKELIPRYEHRTDIGGLETLLRLQLAANRLDDAEATLDRLASTERDEEPRLVPALVPWRVYLRARRYEAKGTPSSQALRRAFDEGYASLDDAQAVAAYARYRADLDALKHAAVASVPTCGTPAGTDCSGTADGVAAWQAYATWRFLLPASQPLLRADARRRFLIDDHVLIPTHDGTLIAALVVRPRIQPASRRVALLNFTIYANDAWSMADAMSMAAHGYVGVVAYARGKGRGTGPIRPYEHDGEDAAAVIDWLASQPWSDGRVGMFSGSYNGFTQWAAAGHHPAALKAIATNATNAPGIDTPMQGNVFQTFIYAWPFYTTDTRGLDEATYDDRDRWNRLRRRWYTSGRPYRDLDRIDGTPNPVFDTWLRHPSYDAYWQRMIPFGRAFADIDIPVFTQTGYFDGGMVGALYYFEQHLAYRPSADHRLLIGPYHHTAMQTGVFAAVRGTRVDPVAMLDLAAIRLAWFDHVFHGDPLPDALSDRVNFEVMGTNRWRHVHDLAAMSQRRWKLYLTGDTQGTGLDLARVPRQAPPDLVVDFRDRSDVDYQPPGSAPDLRHARVFETAPLERSIEVTGLFTASLDVIINKRDVDLAIDLYEVTGDGRWKDIASYLGRASYATDRTSRHLLDADTPTRLKITSQTVAGRRLAKGSRLVAVISVPKGPDRQINYGTGRDVSDESVSDAGAPLRLRFLASSYLDVGVNPSEDD